METTLFNNSTVRLPRSGLLTLTGASGVRVKCRSGLLWVTTESDPNDYWLRDEDSVIIPTDGRVVIQAEQDSWFAIGRRWQE